MYHLRLPVGISCPSIPLSVWISPCRAEKWARHPNTEDTWMVGEEPSTPDGLALRKPMVSASHYLSISHLSVANPEQVFSPVLTKENMTDSENQVCQPL